MGHQCMYPSHHLGESNLHKDGKSRHFAKFQHRNRMASIESLQRSHLFAAEIYYFDTLLLCQNSHLAILYPRLSSLMERKKSGRLILLELRIFSL